MALTLLRHTRCLAASPLAARVFAAAAGGDRLAAIKALREASGAPVTDVKAALTEAGWDQGGWGND